MISIFQPQWQEGHNHNRSPNCCDCRGGWIQGPIPLTAAGESFRNKLTYA